jgi:integrase
MASFTPHKGGWRAHVYKHGQRKTKVFAKKGEAIKWARDKESELDALAGSGHTFGQAVTKYKKTVSSKKDSPEWEARRLNAMLEHFGASRSLAKIDSDAIGLWREVRLETVSGSTVLREANLLRNLFTVAVDEWRWLERNPFKGVKLPKHNPARQAIWTWPLIRRVLRAPRSGKTAEMQRAFRVSLHTGMRMKEVLTGKYDPRRRVYVVPNTKTSATPVSIPLTKRACAILTTQPFAVSANEGSVLFGKLCRELLIEGLTFHDARGSALTWLSRRMDVLTLSRISQHKDLNILLEHYYRETPDQIAARI